MIKRDYLFNENDAYKLIAMIRAYYARLERQVKVWLEEGEFNGQRFYSVRSNIRFKPL